MPNKFGHFRVPSKFANLLAKLRILFELCKSFLYLFPVFFQLLKLTSIVDGRVNGRVMGGMTGGVKGGMEMARLLYLKGSAPFDGRDEPYCSIMLPYLQIMSHYWELFIPSLGTNYSQAGNKIFPPWE